MPGEGGVFKLMNVLIPRPARERKKKRAPTELPRGMVAQPLPAIRQLGRRETILHARRYQHVYPQQVQQRYARYHHAASLRRQRRK